MERNEQSTKGKSNKNQGSKGQNTIGQSNKVQGSKDQNIKGQSNEGLSTIDRSNEVQSTEGRSILQKMKAQNKSQGLNYQNMFWLFMIANVIGVIMEGFWTLFKFGRWETHVNCIWGPFCFIYGIGAVVFYIGSVRLREKHFIVQFVIFALTADMVEYICATLLEEILGMKAWTYKHHFMNLQGKISLPMTFIWGITGIVYLHFLEPRICKLFKRMQGKFWKVACVALSAFMVVNLVATVMCLVRWSHRHQGIEASNQVEEFIDKTYDDDKMRNLFCEWWFIDEGQAFWAEYKKR